MNKPFSSDDLVWKVLKGQQPIVISGETRWGKTRYCVWLPSLGVRSNPEARVWVNDVPSMARVEKPLAWETVQCHAVNKPTHQPVVKCLNL